MTARILGIALLAATLLAYGGKAQAQAATANPAQTLLNPPSSVFSLPSTVLGQVRRDPQGVFIQPHGMDAYSVAMYEVSVVRSLSAAEKSDRKSQHWARAGEVGLGTGFPAGTPPATIAAHPAGGWVYGTYSGTYDAHGGGSYNFSAGGVFHNLVFGIQASCHLPHTAHGPCLTWTAATLEHLLARARGYAAAHPAGDRLPASGGTAWSAWPPTTPAPTARPAPTAVPAPDPAQEFGTVASAEGFLSTQLGNFVTFSQAHDEGLLSSNAFGAVAQRLQHTPDQIIDNLQSMAMAGRYATARALLVAGLRNVKYLWESVMASGGQSYDAGYYNSALADLQLAEQYVAPS